MELSVTETTCAIDELPCADISVEEGKVFRVGNIDIHPLFTPGHTDHHHAYYVNNGAQIMLFSGDALLIDGCGRTDFQSGDARTLYKSIHEKFFSLPDETLVYPCHDYEGRFISSVAQEKQRNLRLGQNKSQCDHCLVFHDRAVRVARRKDNVPEWNWKDELISATLFLHLDGSKLSAIEWQRWQKTWADFSRRINSHHPGLASYLAYAVGIARHDVNLMNDAFSSISASVEDSERLKGIIRDIDGVVIFMKAATSKNRSDSTIIENLKSRGIQEL